MELARLSALHGAGRHRDGPPLRVEPRGVGLQIDDELSQYGRRYSHAAFLYEAHFKTPTDAPKQLVPSCVALQPNYNPHSATTETPALAIL
jgi:hypothetical protein